MLRMIVEHILGCPGIVPFFDLMASLRKLNFPNTSLGLSLARED